GGAARSHIPEGRREEEGGTGDNARGTGRRDIAPGLLPEVLRTTNVIERLHGEFRRRVKTEAALPTEDAALGPLFLQRAWPTWLPSDEDLARDNVSQRPRCAQASPPPSAGGEGTGCPISPHAPRSAQ